MSHPQITIALNTGSFPMLREALEKEFRIHGEGEDPSRVRALVVAAAEGVTSVQLDRFPNVELVAVYGVGVDGLDLDHLRARKLLLANTPAVLDDAVAEHAMALMLSAARKIREGDKFIRDGKWGEAIFPLARGLQGKRCGIVGLGRIGYKIARLAEAFGLVLAYHGRHRQQNVSYEYFDNLLALAKGSDILVLALPGGTETEGMVNQEILKALGSKGLLINIARGSIVDEEALIEALKSGDLGGAALDVFASEPNLPDTLLELPDVVLTPHIGCGTQEARRSMLELTMENLRAHFAGHPVPGLHDL